MTAYESEGPEEGNSEVSSARSSVELQEVAAQARASGVEQQEDEEDRDSKIRPRLTRAVETSTSMAVIETLPLQREPDTPAEERGHQDKKKALPSSSVAAPPSASIPTSQPAAGGSTSNTAAAAQAHSEAQTPSQSQSRSQSSKQQCFASAWYTQVIAWAIFAVIVIADGYVLITTFEGEQ